MALVYMATNMVNGKSYVGFTTQKFTVLRMARRVDRVSWSTEVRA